MVRQQRAARVNARQGHEGKVMKNQLGGMFWGWHRVSGVDRAVWVICGRMEAKA
jgi:hypothetical protein